MSSDYKADKMEGTFSVLHIKFISQIYGLLLIASYTEYRGEHILHKYNDNIKTPTHNAVYII